MTRPLASVTAALAVLLLCAGCASAASSAAPSQPPAPVTSSAPPVDPTPTTTPTITPEPVAERIVVTAKAVSVLGSDGSTAATFDYFAPVSSAVEELSEVFGTEPAFAHHPGSYNRPPFTTYEWDGLVLNDPEGPADAPFSNAWMIIVTARDVAGTAVDTAEGVRIGDSAPALEAAFPESWSRVECCGAPERTDFRLGAEPVDASAEELAAYVGGDFEGPFEFAVWLMAADPAATVTEFRAPSPNCCGI